MSNLPVLPSKTEFAKRVYAPVPYKCGLCGNLIKDDKHDHATVACTL